MKKFGKTIISIIIVCLAVLCIPTQVINAKEFTVKDVPTTDESYEHIQWVLNQGYMKLTLDNFYPNKYVRRDEFALILTKVSGEISSLKTPITPSFKDVLKNNQYFRYIETSKNYITCYKTAGGYLFKPANYITREDAVMAIVKVMGFDSDQAINDGVESELPLEEFIEDEKNISPTLKKYVGIAVLNQLIDIRTTQDKNYFDPKKNINRKQLAMFLYNAYQNREYGKEEFLEKYSEDNEVDSSLNSKDIVKSSTVIDKRTIGHDCTDWLDLAKEKIVTVSYPFYDGIRQTNQYRFGYEGEWIIYIGPIKVNKNVYVSTRVINEKGEVLTTGGIEVGKIIN
jgi:hypothetical protein